MRDPPEGGRGNAGESRSEGIFEKGYRETLFFLPSLRAPGRASNSSEWLRVEGTLSTRRGRP